MIFRDVQTRDKSFLIRASSFPGAGVWFGAYQRNKNSEPSGNWFWVDEVPMTSTSGRVWFFSGQPDNYEGFQDCGLGLDLFRTLRNFQQWTLTQPPSGQRKGPALLANEQYPAETPAHSPFRPPALTRGNLLHGVRTTPVAPRHLPSAELGRPPLAPLLSTTPSRDQPTLPARSGDGFTIVQNLRTSKRRMPSGAVQLLPPSEPLHRPRKKIQVVRKLVGLRRDPTK